MLLLRLAMLFMALVVRELSGSLARWCLEFKAEYNDPLWSLFGKEFSSDITGDGPGGSAATRRRRLAKRKSGKGNGEELQKFMSQMYVMAMNMFGEDAVKQALTGLFGCAGAAKSARSQTNKQTRVTGAGSESKEKSVSADAPTSQDVFLWQRRKED